MFTKMYFKYFTHKSENEITSVDIFLDQAVQKFAKFAPFCSTKVELSIFLLQRVRYRTNVKYDNLVETLLTFDNIIIF